MGYEAYAECVVGYRIAPASHAYITEIVKVGDHDFAKNILFHPTTGKRLWREEVVPRWGDLPLPSVLVPQDSIETFIEPYFESGDAASEPLGAGFVVVGLNVSWSPARRQIGRVLSPEMVSAIRSKLDEALPEDLRRAEDFGMWTFVHHSY